MINMEKLLASVKKHEGYRNKVYLDTLNKRTVGVGHLCVEDFWEDDKEYEEKFLMTILEHDLSTAIKGANELMAKNGCMDMNEKAHEIISHHPPCDSNSFEGHSKEGTSRPLSVQQPPLPASSARSSPTAKFSSP